jgi:hypothetical protein
MTATPEVSVLKVCVDELMLPEFQNSKLYSMLPDRKLSLSRERTGCVRGQISTLAAEPNRALERIVHLRLVLRLCLQTHRHVFQVCT